MKKNLPFVLVLIGVGVFFYFRYLRAPNIKTEEVVIIRDNGRLVSLSTVMEGAAVVHFYASWCGPCMQEMREVRDNYDKLKAKGLNFIFITDDDKSTMRQIQSGMPEEIRFYRTKSLKEIGIRAIPSTYFFNQQKEITEKIVNKCPWNDDAFVDRVSSLVNK